MRRVLGLAGPLPKGRDGSGDEAMSAAERQRITALEGEVRQLRQVLRTLVGAARSVPDGLLVAADEDAGDQGVEPVVGLDGGDDGRRGRGGLVAEVAGQLSGG